MPEGYTQLARKKIADHAPLYGGKIVLVLRDHRYGMKVIIILNEDGTPYAWPESMDKQEVHDVVRKYGQ